MDVNNCGEISKYELREMYKYIITLFNIIKFIYLCLVQATQSMAITCLTS